MTILINLVKPLIVLFGVVLAGVATYFKGKSDGKKKEIQKQAQQEQEKSIIILNKEVEKSIEKEKIDNLYNSIPDKFTGKLRKKN